jgi:hypothetical protein
VLSGCTLSNPDTSVTTIPPIETGNNHGNIRPTTQWQPNTEYESNNNDLKEFYSNGQVLLWELSIGTTDAKSAMSQDLNALKSWPKALGFDGYVAGDGTTIRFMDFQAKDQAQHSLVLTYLSKQQTLDYRVTFTSNFDKINAEELVMYLKVVFGVDFDESKFIDTCDRYAATVETLKPEEIDEEIFYQKDGITLRISMFNYNGEFYVALKGVYEA